MRPRNLEEYVICPRCRALSPEGSNYCFQCGAALGLLDEFIFSNESGQGGMPALEGPLADVPELHWFLVLVYNIITLGIYGSVWFLRRLGAFQRLRSERRLNPGLLTASLVFTIASLGCALTLIVMGEGSALVVAGLPVTDLLDDFSTFLDLSAWLMLAHQALRLRRMIKDHVAAQGRHVAITALWTILFQNINLQHAINGLKRHGRS
ncbi:zinc ribbon domain-containing protein [Desulfocurvibacter africanus]|uniref:zinc ribbon domain-containing protein n=1 Tax=Desulfocurvibacter africanus TaxID=873 RepID=UPI001FCB4916|nr:zinc ribbon domain-containing protein [Desulfocurvibacter africanus]